MQIPEYKIKAHELQKRVMYDLNRINKWQNNLIDVLNHINQIESMNDYLAVHEEAMVFDEERQNE